MPQPLLFSPQKKNLFTENIRQDAVNSPYTGEIPLTPALAKSENMSRLPTLFTPTEYKKEGVKLVKERTAQPAAANAEAMPVVTPVKPVAAPFKAMAKQAVTTQVNPIISPLAKPPEDNNNGEYSTLRKVGTGLANFAEHFGNAMSGVGNAGVTNRWDAIKQEYREKAPNSNISKLYQDTYKKFGIDTKGKSAWDLKQMHPDIKYLQDQSQMEDANKLAMMQASMRGSGTGTGAPKIKDPTEGERKNLGYYERMKNADSIIDSTKGYTGNEFFQAPEFLGNMAKSKERQLVDNAKRDWMIANLRKESGAAIGSEEYDSQDKTYFPQRGDSKETLENKRKQREQVRRNTFLEAGNAAAQKHLGGN